MAQQKRTPWVLCEGDPSLQPLLSWSAQHHLPLLAANNIANIPSCLNHFYCHQLLKVTTTGGWLLWRGPALHLSTVTKFNFLDQPALEKAVFTFCSSTMLVKSSSSSAISSSIQSLSIPWTNKVYFFLTEESPGNQKTVEKNDFIRIVQITEKPSIFSWHLNIYLMLNSEALAFFDQPNSKWSTCLPPLPSRNSARRLSVAFHHPGSRNVNVGSWRGSHFSSFGVVPDCSFGFWEFALS